MFSWWRSPINLGVLIAMTEAVRVKCGAREGLLSFLIKPIDRHVDAETARRAAMTPDEIMVERLEAAYAVKQEAAAARTTQQQPTLDGQEGGQEILDEVLSDKLPALNTNQYATLQDPTLRTEGLAWFPDLTVPDTTLLLPLALSATMALTVLARPKTNPAPTSASHSKRTVSSSKELPVTPDNPLEALAALPKPKSLLDHLSTGQKIGLSLSFVFFFAALKLPVAVLLYLMPSMAMGWLQSRWLDLKYPLPEVVRACRRPVRVKVRKEFRDA